VLTDNGVGDRSRLFGAALADTGVRHQRTRPYRPQTNGKVERCNRTLLEEWAYRRLDRSNAARDRAWPPWVHRYNHHRAPTPSAGGHPSAASTTSLITTPRADENGEPLYLVQLIALTDGAAEILAVKVAGMPSGIRQGHPVKVTGLVAQPWTMNDRSGVAFRAARVEPVVAQAKAS
jgi:hypothetical protein